MNSLYHHCRNPLQLLLIITITTAVLAGCHVTRPAPDSEWGSKTDLTDSDNDIHWYSVRVKQAFPHDPEAFTQGLIFRNGTLYESTGRRGQSTLRRVDLESGDVLKIRHLDDTYFGEGLVDWNEWLIQLTLSAGKGFIYDLETFDHIGTFAYPGEGWGLTHNGTHLIMSDGSPWLRYLDPETFQEVHRVEVREGGRPVRYLNELERVEDRVLANILFEDYIVVIDLDSGEVTGRIDLEGLLPESDRSSGASVLNGIAWDAESDRLFVTGKLWPRLYEIEVDW